MCDLDSGLTLGACVLPANVPEEAGATKKGPGFLAYGTLEEIQMDRALLSSPFVIDADDVREATGLWICRLHHAVGIEELEKLWG